LLDSRNRCRPQWSGFRVLLHQPAQQQGSENPAGSKFSGGFESQRANVHSQQAKVEAFHADELSTGCASAFRKAESEHFRVVRITCVCADPVETTLFAARGTGSRQTLEHGLDNPGHGQQHTD
jgi:hypothetical protein